MRSAVNAVNGRMDTRKLQGEFIYIIHISYNTMSSHIVRVRMRTGLVRNNIYAAHARAHVHDAPDIFCII